MLLKLLTLALLVITIALGIYGTTHEFRKDGTPTRAGRLAVVGLIMSGLIAIALQFVEFNKEEQASQTAKSELDKSRERQEATLERTERANQTLGRVVSDIDRGLHPITSISVSFTLDLATDS